MSEREREREREREGLIHDFPNVAESVETVEHIDCISTEGYHFPNESRGYDTKKSDVEALVNLEHWGMWNTLSLSSLPGQL